MAERERESLFSGETKSAQHGREIWPVLGQRIDKGGRGRKK